MFVKASIVHLYSCKHGHTVLEEKKQIQSVNSGTSVQLIFLSPSKNQQRSKTTTRSQHCTTAGSTSAGGKKKPNVTAASQVPLGTGEGLQPLAW